MQKSLEGPNERMGCRWISRLACKHCFVNNLSGSDNSTRYPDMLRAGACALAHSPAQMSAYVDKNLARIASRFMEPSPSAYSLSQIFEGICV